MRVLVDNGYDIKLKGYNVNSHINVVVTEWVYHDDDATLSLN